MEPLAGLEVELVGRRADHWQLDAIDGHLPDAPGCAAALVDATAAPVMIAVISDSDTALLLADSPAVTSGSPCSTPRPTARAARRSPISGR